MISQKFKNLTLDKQAGIVFTVIGMFFGAGWAAYFQFTKKPDTPQIPSVSGTIIADNGAFQVISMGSGDVTINLVDPLVKKIIEALLTNQNKINSHTEELNQQVKELLKTIAALRAREKQPGVKEALLLLAKGERGKAEQLFQDTLEQKKKEGRKSLKEAAAAARHIGSLAYLYDTQKALQAYKEAVALEPENASGRNQLGQLLFRSGDLGGAEKSFRAVLKIGTTVNDREWIAITYVNLGNINQTWGELNKAETMYIKSLEIFQTLGRKDGMAGTYNNLGLIYRSQGELDKAEAMFKKSLEIFQTLGRKLGMASIYGNLGLIYRTRGEQDKSEAMFKKSLEIFQTLGRKLSMAKQYGNLGLIYRTRGDLDKAEAMHNKSLEIFQTLRYKEGMATEYSHMGLIYNTRGKLDKAETMFNKSLEIFQTLEHKEGMANIYGNLGLIYRKRGELDKAEVMFHKSLSLFQEIGAQTKAVKAQGMLKSLLNMRQQVIKKN